MKKIKLTGANRYVLKGQLYEKGIVYTVNDALGDALLDKMVVNTDTPMFSEARQKDEALPNKEVGNKSQGKPAVVKKSATGTTTVQKNVDNGGGPGAESGVGGNPDILSAEPDPDAPQPNGASGSTSAPVQV